ncbi:Hypothetical predicted protein [Paramuricea clavata]|uniref:Uncharacterized protein n=1 Tax=Paramuricea clavata TaxID=317549 RepID=A0A7D9J120_PARCT|nr:Hypothetical predicted protein [Paramuricea clavata]
MAQHLVLVIVFGVLVCDNVRLVQCADKCKTRADCKSDYWAYCCGGYFGSKDRSCTSGSCLNHYCSSDSDCGDPSMCCRSNKCANKGCSGCTKNSDCYGRHVCCKKTFLLNQTVCAANCINQTCNSNSDCAGWGECCRSGKCVKTGCSDKCTSNSECNLDEYCCKKKSSGYWGDSCAKSCVGEFCWINDDCGARNECCISNKCVDRGCSGCTTNSHCSSGHYCCKKRQWYVGEFSECSEHCIGKSCSTSDDCGGPGETCDSEHRCAVNQNSNSLSSWAIAVITVSLVVFLIVVGITLAVFWYVKRKRPTNATQAGTVPLQNTSYQGTQIQNQQPNTQFSHLNNPTAFQNYPHHGNNNVARQSHNPSHYPHGFQYGAQGYVDSPPNYDDQGHHTTLSSYPAQSDNEIHQNHNRLHDPVYHTLKSPEVTKDAQFQDISGQQMYPQNAPRQGHDYHHHPPYNPQYQGKP